MIIAHDFLANPTDDRLKRELTNICDSYSHPWDILAELLQNSVDSIRLFNKTFGLSKEHRIEIAIDGRDRSIALTDTGLGFDPDRVPALLAPHGTDKTGNDYSIIGEKGVGLKYVIFSSEYFELETASAKGKFRGMIEYASPWRRGANPNRPLFNIVEQIPAQVDPATTYTKIAVKGLDPTFSEVEDLFDQSPQVLQFLLRTKTAVGSTRQVFAMPNEKVQVSMKVTKKDGQSGTFDVPFQFMLPEEMLAPTATIDFDDFIKKAAAMDDRQKTQHLRGKCLRRQGSITRAGRTIRYYAFFAPSRRTWLEISEKNGLVRSEEDSEYDRHLYKGSLEVSTRGMPTGIELTPPVSGYSGYWPNVFMLLEDDSLRFDVGRKFIPGRTQGTLKEVAKEHFNSFVQYAQYITTDPAIPQTLGTLQQYNKTKTFEEFSNLADLKIPNFHYLKHPDSQEAAVVAIFHQLVAGNRLKGYYCLKTGHKMTYDFWGYYELRKEHVGSKWHGTIKEGEKIPIVIEFKYKAEDLLDDFEKDIKFFTDVDLIVAWDFDEPKFARRSVDVSLLHHEQSLFHGANYTLSWPGAYNLGAASQKPLLSLRQFIAGLTG